MFLLFSYSHWTLGAVYLSTTVYIISYSHWTLVWTLSEQLSSTLCASSKFWLEQNTCYEKSYIVFSLFVLQETGRRKLAKQAEEKSRIFYSPNTSNDLKSHLGKRKTKKILYDICFFVFNKIVNKRVSLSSIFLQCFVMKH